MIGRFSKFKNRRTKKCPKCGQPFTDRSINPPLLGLREVAGTSSTNFYGGNVTKFSETTCEKCGAELLLFLRPVNNGYTIHDVAITEEELQGITNSPVDKTEIEEDTKVIEASEDDTDTNSPEDVQDAQIEPQESESDTQEEDLAQDIEKSEEAAEEREYVGDEDVPVVSTQTIDERNMKMLIRAVDDLNEQIAVNAIMNMKQFWNVPKALEQTDIPRESCLTESGKPLKQDQYVEVVKEYIASKKE